MALSPLQSVLIPVIKSVYAQSLAPTIVGVQPMGAPSGMPFKLRFKSKELIEQEVAIIIDELCDL